MSNITAKTLDNAFYQARLRASKHNEQLSSREGAADIMSIDRGRLYRIESGVTYPYPEEVHLMADLYGAPELKNLFCRRCCPLGKNIPKVETSDLDRITIRALATFKRVSHTKELLLDITEDGIITEDERGDLKAIMENLEELEKVAQNLKCWVQKNLD